MKKLFSIALLACLFALIISGSAQAEWIPPFNLDARADRAGLIVEGVLDAAGEFTTLRVLKGSAPATKLSPPQRDKENFALLAKAMETNGPLRAIAFLDEDYAGRWNATGRSGLVGLSANGVYRFTGVRDLETDQREWQFLNGGYDRHPEWTPATFLKA